MLLLPGAVRLLGGMCNLEMRSNFRKLLTVPGVPVTFFLKPALCLSTLPDISCFFLAFILLSGTVLKQMMSLRAVTDCF